MCVCVCVSTHSQRDSDSAAGATGKTWPGNVLLARALQGSVLIRYRVRWRRRRRRRPYFPRERFSPGSPENRPVGASIRGLAFRDTRACTRTHGRGLGCSAGAGEGGVFKLVRAIRSGKCVSSVARSIFGAGNTSARSSQRFPIRSC